MEPKISEGIEKISKKRDDFDEWKYKIIVGHCNQNSFKCSTIQAFTKIL